MRRLAQSLAALCLLAVLVLTSRAGDNADAAAIIGKAVKAHFPKGIDTKNKGLHMKNKGTLHIMGLDLPFTQDISVQSSTKFKEVMELTVMDKKVVVTTVYNGKQGWILADGKDVKVTDEILNELKEATYTMGLMQGILEKDKGVKYTVVGEVQVQGKPAMGLTVSREGKKDVNMFFDKKTGLITKIEMRKRDLMSGQELTEERLITEYQDVSDRKVAKKVEVIRDGKQFLEAEVLEVQILPKIDDGEFAQPK